MDRQSKGHNIQAISLLWAQIKKDQKGDGQRLLQELIHKSKILVDIVVDLKNAEILKLPQNDRIILSTALYHKADVFVTGNEKDFKKLYRKRILGTVILKPVDFLNMNF